MDDQKPGYFQKYTLWGFFFLVAVFSFLWWFLAQPTKLSFKPIEHPLLLMGILLILSLYLWSNKKIGLSLILTLGFYITTLGFISLFLERLTLFSLSIFGIPLDLLFLNVGVAIYFVAIYRVFRKEQELNKELNYAKSLLSFILQYIPDHIYIKDHKSRFVEVSASLAKDFGASKPEDILGKTDFDFFSSPHAKGAFQDEQKIIESGISIIGKEEKETWPDGRENWVSTTKIPWKNEKGEIIGIVGISRDITPMIEQKLELERREQLLSDIIESVQDGLCLLDREMTIIRINRFLEEMYPEEQPLVGKKCYQAFQGRTIPCSICPTQKTFQTGKRCMEIVPYIRGGKQVGWLELVSHPLRDKQGTIQGVIEQVLNVTEKKKAEEELKERETHFRLLAESNPTAILIYQDDRIVYANSATAKLFGYTQEELLGMPLLKLVHPDFAPLAQEKIRRRQENLPTEKQYEIKVITKDNQERWVFLSAETIPYHGKWAGLVSALDVTEQKRIQERSQHLNLVLQAIRNVNQILARQRTESLSLSDIPQEMTQSGAYTSFFIILFPHEEKPGQKFSSKIQPAILDSLIPLLKEKLPLSHKIYSFLSLPNISLPPTEGLLATNITYQGEILGLMGATTSLEFLSSSQEQELFLELGEDIAFALHNFTLQTRERKIQKLLEENEQKFRTLVERLPLGIVIIQNGIPLYTNPFFESVAGEHQESFLRQLLQLDFEQQESEFPFVTEGTKPRWFLVYKSQIQYQGGDATLFSLMDITEKKRDEELIQYLASYDSLTGLYNRGFFEREMKKFDRPDNLPLSIIMGDLNGLKLLNDAFGHEEGDQMLRRAAQTFKKICPPESLIARFGGDEFVALLPRTSHEKTQEIANQIQATFASELFHSIPVSISLGFGTKVDETQTIPDILRIAENWMYQKKSVDGVSFRLQTFQFIQKVLREATYEGEEHSQRIKKWALRVAQSLGLSEREKENLALLAEFHDIGKVAISKEIWQKPGPLTEEEWNTAKKHSEIGFRITQAIGELASIAHLVLSHHEWYNGQGYPRRLKGEAIPLLDRILAVCDAFEVMISGRPYKKPRTWEEAIEELKRCAGTQFDPYITEIFVRLLAQENLYHNK